MSDSDRAAFHQAYRRTIGRFATGVTVVLAERDGDVRGMTASAVTSVSLEPTLLLFCPAKRSRIAEILDVGTSFTVNVLGADQTELSNAFARPDAEIDADAHFRAWPEAGSAPRLQGTIAALGCRVHARHDGGDHWIVVGEVVALDADGEGPDPLLYFDGAYRRMHATD